METQTNFPPARQLGLTFHAAAGVILLGVAALVFLQVFQRETGQMFVSGVLLSVLLACPVPLLIYRGYALAQASYFLDRDGLRIRWGLRAEDIPLPQIEWVRPADELGFHLPLPFLQWPGAVTGRRTVQGLGTVEFIASDVRKLLLVATPDKVYAISPADERSFVRTYRHIIELGSLTPIVSRSILPAAFLQRVWMDRLARWMIIAGIGITFLLLAAVILLIPAHPSIFLGYDALRRPLEPVSPDRLLLLPFLGGVLNVVDLLVGLFFYRLNDQRMVAYILWGSSSLLPLLLLLAVFLI